MTNRLIRPMMLFIGILPLLALIAFMLAYGGSEYPFGDTNVTSVHTAIKTANGTLSIEDLLEIHYGHRMIFSRALTAVATAVTGWDTRIEVWSNFVLGVLNWLLLVWLFARYHPIRAYWILFPAGVFILTTDQAINWLAGVHNVWHFALFFSLLSLLSLTYTAQKWRSIGLAVIFAYCATFSMASGLVVWGVVLIALLFLNYRDWKHYLLVIIAGAMAVGLYFSNTGMGGGWTSPEYGRIIPPDLLTAIHFVLILFGRPIVNDIALAPIIGGLAIIIFWVNIGIYWRREKSLIGMAIWLPVASYSVGNAILLALTRHYYFGTSIALTERYLHPTLPFWVAVFAVCLINLNTKRLMVGVNMAFMVLMLVAHGMMLNREWRYLEFDLPVEGVQIQSDCLSRFPISQYTACWDTAKHAPFVNNMQLLASWRLAGYARIPQTMILTPYQAEKIIINTETIWQGIHIRDFLLDGIAHADILYIATDGQEAIFMGDVQRSPYPPQLTLFGDMAQNHQRVLDFASDQDALWYITRPQLYADETLWQYRQTLEAQFAPARQFITSDNVVVTRYIRPFDTAQVAMFDDAIGLVGWRFLTSPHACDVAVLQTAWQIETPQAQTIHLSWALVDDPITRAIDTVDAPISPIPIQFWDVGMVYYDERVLTIPCDLPAGAYQFTVTLYGVGDDGVVLPNLPVTSDRLPIDGHLLIIGAMPAP